MKALLFHSRSKELQSDILPSNAPRLLSNFALLDVEYQGVIYPSVEHAFQTAKFAFTNKPNFKLSADVTPLQAKKTGSKTGMKTMGAILDVKAWDQASNEIMKTLLQSKIERHGVIRDILKTCRDQNIKLIHFERGRNPKWGAVYDATEDKIVKGNNLLGNYYTHLSK